MSVAQKVDTGKRDPLRRVLPGFSFIDRGALPAHACNPGDPTRRPGGGVAPG
jgi:hypothetical protein